MAIYVTGSLAYDRVMNFPGSFSDYILPDKIHMLNVCFPIGKLDVKRGGTGGNIVYNLSLLGEKPVLLSTAGKDFAGYRAELLRLGLPLDGIRTYDDEYTAGAYITTDQNSNQITGFYPAAMNRRCEYAFPALDAERDIAIIAPTNSKDMVLHADTYKRHGVRYIFDPGQQVTSLTPDELRSGIDGAFILVSNDYELALIMQLCSLTHSELLSMAGCVITTYGGEGSKIQRNGQKEITVKACPVPDVKDPTGAGDTYRAGLIKGLLHGMTVEDSAVLASVCASFCVEQYATQEHQFPAEEFARRLASVSALQLPFELPVR